MKTFSNSDRARRQKRLEIGHKIIRHLYKGVNSFEISLDYRQNVADIGDKSLTYGEVVIESFLQILLLIEKSSELLETEYSKLRSIQSRTFVDLGCGAGRAVMTAALSIGSNFDKLIGIDIVPGLITLSMEIKSSFLNAVSAANSSGKLKNISKMKCSKEKISTGEKIPPTLLDILSPTKNAFSKSNSNEMNTDTLANIVCKDMGHKAFKNALKPYKGFIKMIESNDSIFHLNKETNIITLLSSPSLSLEGQEVDEKNSNIEFKFQNIIGEIHSTIEESNFNSEKNSVKILELLHETESLNAFLPIPEIVFEVGNIFEVDWWTDCYVAYAASLLFSEEMMVMLSQKVLLMHSGSWFISLKPLILPDGDSPGVGIVSLEHETFFKMSWQMARVYIYRIQ